MAIKYDGKYLFKKMAFDQQKVPVFLEVKTKEWVYYGENNDYPEYLLKLYNRSPKHNAIINSKVNYIIGAGMSVDVQRLTVGKQGELWSFIREFDLVNVAKKCIVDYEIFGGFALEVVWSKNGKRIAELNHFDFSKIRINTDEDKFFFTKRWVIYDKNGNYKINPKPDKEDDWEEFEPFDDENPSGSQLYYCKEYRPALDVYPLPGYIGANVAIETDIEINNYHYNNLKNGFTATILLNFYNGIPTEDEQTKLEKMIKTKLAGSDNAGKFIMNFSDGKDKSCEVTVLQMSDAHEQFEMLRQDTMQEIFIGHRITSPMLMGVRTEGQLGGRSELVEANELFKNIYVKPKQGVIEKVFNSLLRINGFEDRLRFNEPSPISPVEPYNDNPQGKAATPTTAKVKSTTVTHKYKAENLIKIFSKYGRSKKGFEFIKSSPLNFFNDEKELEEKESSFMRFDDKDNKSAGITGNLPDIIKTKTTSLVYSYEWRAGFSMSDYDESREFCKKLMDLDRIYTRQEINMISSEVGYSVFLHMGGWYTEPGTDKHLPHCRHEWNMHAIIE